MKDIDKVSLTYNDSQNPGRVVFGIDEGRVKLNLTVAEAATLGGRLLDAVRNSGYTITAKRGR